MVPRAQVTRLQDAPVVALSDDAALSVLPLHDHVYRTLRQWIMAGRFLPGDTFSASQVASALGTSTMPVRDAMRRLASEGGLIILPKRAASVPSMSRAEFEDLARVRLAVEGLATELAVRMVDDALIERLLAMDRAMEALVDEGRWHAYAAANQAFHFALYGASGSGMLVSLIEGLWLRIGPFQNLWGTMGIAVGRDRHHDAVSALRRGDAQAARAIIEADIKAGTDLILAHAEFGAKRRARSIESAA